MFGLIRKIIITQLIFSGSLASMINYSNHTKLLSLNNQPCIARLTLINLNLDKYNQGLHYCPFTVNLDRCNESCKTFTDPPDKICAPNNTEDINVSVFSKIARINELKSLTKHVSCKCECKLDSKTCNSKQKWNSDKCRCKWKHPKERHMC